MTYRIYRAANPKKFVETDSTKLIKSILKEEAKNNNKMIVKVLRGTRWYTIDPERGL